MRDLSDSTACIADANEPDDGFAVTRVEWKAVHLFGENTR
jgi:hypothetical protein